MRHCQVMLLGRWSKKTKKVKAGRATRNVLVVQMNIRAMLVEAGIFTEDRELYVGAVLHTLNEDRTWESLAGYDSDSAMHARMRQIDISRSS
jgi:hypothetical protein